MSPGETAQVLAMLRGAYQREINEEQAIVWTNTFAVTPFDECMWAAQVWIEGNSWPPTPADLRRLIRDARRRREMDAPPLPEIGPVDKLISGPDGGFAIAYRAYSDYVRSKHREPRPFAEFSGALAREAREQRTTRRHYR